MFFCLLFLFASRVFLIAATLKKWWPYWGFATFSLFAFFLFSDKNHPKSMRKHGPKKSFKNHGSGIHFGTQNRWKSTPEGPKSAQFAKKCRFWTVLCFYRVFDAFFDEIWVPQASPGGVQNRPFRSLFRLFWAPVASELLLGSPGTISGQFFIDFRSILGRHLVDFWLILAPSRDESSD